MTDKLVNNENLANLLKKTQEGFPKKSLYILEIPIFNFENGFPFMQEFLKEEIIKKTNIQELQEKLILKAQEFSPDILGLKFNIGTKNDIPKAVKILKSILPQISIPLMIRGTNDDNIDVSLLPELIKYLDRECIVASANEKTYKKIVPLTKNNHYIVLRSPIDINLAKEINILSFDLGQPLEKIMIDTDIGSLGYGFEYGYSIIEKIKLESKNDIYLSAPIISFACEEALKTKETKSKDFSDSWGNLNDRIKFFEIAAASAIRAAGADLIVVNNPNTLKIMKGLD